MSQPDNRTPEQPFDKLSGLVERVTYHNEANGFCVLRVKVKGERDLVTLVGHAPSVTPANTPRRSAPGSSTRSTAGSFARRSCASMRPRPSRASKSIWAQGW